ncbi:hypothetical protein AWM75_01325 [Aerococcus urinaehominis]|uniref:Uncharacterized protein n=1 Tax=Aerococcus urinaehominis TaxID=128944 RepID=A0A0X8FJZ3_9LACT|nr:glycerophosphodiester phosphodiesterase family protein [Aerococcus urinaehominis]AMB98718.1 hypothetical protein AWM75_01325 [Aerococcus urinaehominis]SDL99966.1 Glycerophosphoryl diester phosphodiesterase family protein [Aerococcus urinaehominis]
MTYLPPVQKNAFNSLLNHRDFLIIAHRGFWGGNIIQNTRQAAILAKRAGADVVEVDVCRSQDGVYYLFHNGHENQLLGLGNQDFSQFTSGEIDQASFLNSVEATSGYYCERLADFLA